MQPHHKPLPIPKYLRKKRLSQVQHSWDVDPFLLPLGMRPAIRLVPETTTVGLTRVSYGALSIITSYFASASTVYSLMKTCRCMHVMFHNANLSREICPHAVFSSDLVLLPTCPFPFVRILRICGKQPGISRVGELLWLAAEVFPHLDGFILDAEPVTPRDARGRIRYNGNPFNLRSFVKLLLRYHKKSNAPSSFRPDRLRVLVAREETRMLSGSWRRASLMKSWWWYRRREWPLDVEQQLAEAMAFRLGLRNPAMRRRRRIRRKRRRRRRGTGGTTGGDDDAMVENRFVEQHQCYIRGILDLCPNLERFELDSYIDWWPEPSPGRFGHHDADVVVDTNTWWFGSFRISVKPKKWDPVASNACIPVFPQLRELSFEKRICLSGAHPWRFLVHSFPNVKVLRLTGIGWHVDSAVAFDNVMWPSLEKVKLRALEHRFGAEGLVGLFKSAPRLTWVRFGTGCGIKLALEGDSNEKIATKMGEVLQQQQRQKMVRLVRVPPRFLAQSRPGESFECAPEFRSASFGPFGRMLSLRVVGEWVGVGGLALLCLKMPNLRRVDVSRSSVQKATSCEEGEEKEGDGEQQIEEEEEEGEGETSNDNHAEENDSACRCIVSVERLRARSNELEDGTMRTLLEKFPKLRKLDCSYNRLQRVFREENIPLADSLLFLDVAFNRLRLEDFGAILRNYPSLIGLDITSNLIGHKPESEEDFWDDYYTSDAEYYFAQRYTRPSSGSEERQKQFRVPEVLRLRVLRVSRNLLLWGPLFKVISACASSLEQLEFVGCSVSGNEMLETRSRQDDPRSSGSRSSPPSHGGGGEGREGWKVVRRKRKGRKARLSRRTTFRPPVSCPRVEYLRFSAGDFSPRCMAFMFRMFPNLQAMEASGISVKPLSRLHVDRLVKAMGMERLSHYQVDFKSKEAMMDEASRRQEVAWEIADDQKEVGQFCACACCQREAYMRKRRN